MVPESSRVTYQDRVGGESIEDVGAEARCRCWSGEEDWLDAGLWASSPSVWRWVEGEPSFQVRSVIMSVSVWGSCCFFLGMVK